MTEYRCDRCGAYHEDPTENPSYEGREVLNKDNIGTMKEVGDD